MSEISPESVLREFDRHWRLVADAPPDEPYEFALVRWAMRAAYSDALSLLTLRNVIVDAPPLVVVEQLRADVEARASEVVGEEERA